jgi:hypothetical protein
MAMVVTLLLEVMDADGNCITAKELPPETWKQDGALFTNRDDLYLPVQQPGLPDYIRLSFSHYEVSVDTFKTSSKMAWKLLGDDTVTFPRGSLRLDVHPRSENMRLLTTGKA